MHSMEKVSSMHAEPSGFAEIVAPLERAFGKRLNGLGRAMCVAAFLQEPDGFARIVSDVLQRGRGFGLLIRMVEDDEHLLAVAARSVRTIQPAPPGTRCYVDDEPIEEGVREPAGWFCPKHAEPLDDAA